MMTEIPDEAALALEFDVLARRARLDIPADRRAGVVELVRLLEADDLDWILPLSILKTRKASKSLVIYLARP